MDNDGPRSGRALYGWLKARDPKLMRRCQAMARRRGYGTYFASMTPVQVAELWHDLVSKPEKGKSQWGSSAPRKEVSADRRIDGR